MARATATVSVVIPAYNAEAHLAECLASVRSQAGGAELEIVVVDDGSTDGTSTVAASHADVVLVRLATNSGPSVARNTGVEASSGRYVAFLDADDLWPRGSLAARLEVLQRRPEAGLVFGDCRQFDAGGEWRRTLFESGHWGATAWGRGGEVPDAYCQLLADNFITTGSVVVRREVLGAVGGFAEDLRLVEDLDLWLRIAHRQPIAWCDEVCLLRRRHAANTSADPASMSLAYLEVLRRQRALAGSSSSHARLDRLVAAECLYLSELALQSGQPRAALRWAWQGARHRPNAKSLARLARLALNAAWQGRG